MNRDDSTETVDQAKNAKSEEAPVVDRNKMIPNQADVDFRKRMSITRAAKRFERYGHVEDAQSLVELIGDIASAVGGKATHVVAARHKKDKS